MSKLIPIGTIIALAITFGIVQAQVKTNEKELDKHEAKIEKTTEEINENEKIDLRQSIIMESIVEKLAKLDEKIDLDLKKKPNR